MKWRQTRMINIVATSMNSNIQRVARVSLIVSKRTTRLVKSNRMSRMSRVIPYVVDFTNTPDASVQHMKSVAEIFIESETLIILFYVLMAGQSLKYYK